MLWSILKISAPEMVCEIHGATEPKLAANSNMKATNVSRKNPSAKLLLAFFGLFSALGVQAAITWGTPTTIAGDTDVVTNGTLVYAYDLNNSAQTVNTVAFAAANSTTSLGSGNVTMSGFSSDAASSTYGSSSAPFANLSIAYKAVLGGGDYASAANTTVTVTLNGLTSGQTYLVQVWADDSRGYARTETNSSAGGNSVVLSYNTANGAGGGLGQYVIGSFVASGTSQAFTLIGAVSSQLNAIQVRNVNPSGVHFSGASATIWDASTTADWGTTAGGPYAQTWTAAGGSSSTLAIFEGTAGTVTVNGSVNVGSLYFLADSYTLGGSGTLTLGGGSITTGVGADTISASLGGSAGLTLNGLNSLTLSGANTYSGTTAVNGGTLVLNSSGALGSSSLISFGGGTLQFSANNTADCSSLFSQAASQAYKLNVPAGVSVTLASGITSSGGTLSQSGAGTLILSGNNTFSGGTTISAGTVKAGSATAFNTNSPLNMAGTGLLDLGGYNLTFTNLASMVAGNVVTTTGAGIGTNTLTIMALTLNGLPGLFTNGSTEKLALNLTSSGAGAIVATSNTNNNYSGGLILGSTMRINPYAASATTGVPGAITNGPFGTGPITVGPTAAIYFNGANLTLVNDVIVNGNTGNGSRSGTFRVSATGSTVSGTINANQAPATFSADTTASLLASGRITGTNGLTANISSGSTAWTMTLSNVTANPNDYQGLTSVAANTTLALGAAEQIPNGAGKGNVSLAGKLNLGGYNETLNGLTGAGTVDNLTAANPVNTLTLGDGDATGNTFSGIIQNSAGSILNLTKIGAGIQTLSGANSYTGTNSINNGTLTLSGSGTLGAAGNALSLNGGTLNLGTTSQTVGAVTMASGMLTNGTLTASSYAVQSGIIAAVIGGASATLTKTGNGTLVLTNVNTYGGATTVTGGKVIGVTGGSCGSSAFTFSPSAGAATTNAVFVASAAGQWTCAALTDTTANGGTIYAEFDYGTVTGPSTTTAPMYVTGDGNVSGTLNVNIKNGFGWITGQTYPLVQIGGNAPASIALNLVGQPTGVSGGSLSYDSVNKVISYVAGTAPRSLTWNAGSGLWDINTSTNWLDASLNLTKFQQLDLTAFNDTLGAGAFVVTNNSAVTPQNFTVNNNAASYTFTGSGAIGGTTTLTKAGTNSLTIASANTYSGGTVVSNGTLVLANASALGSGTLDIEGGSLDSMVPNLINANNNPITLDNDLIFLGSQNMNLGGGAVSFGANRQIAVSNNTLTVAGPISATSAALTKGGSGTLLLLNTGNAYTGTTVSQGTLRQGAANTLGVTTGGLTMNGGTLDLNGFALTVNALAGTTNGVILNNGGSGQVVLTLGNGNSGSTFSGSIADNSAGAATIALAKIGTGNQALAGSNSYSGPTTINSGTGGGCLFTVSNPNALGTTNGEVTEVDNNNCVLLNNNITVSGKTINIWGTGGSPSTGNGNGSLQGNVGQTNQWAGIVRMGNGITQGRVGVRVSGASTGVLILSGSLRDGLSASGAGLGLVVNCDTVGSAVVIAAPAGVNTYSGQTAIGRGTLQLGATNTLPTNTVLNVGSAGSVSAVFDLNGFDQTVGGLTKSGANTSTILNSSLTATNTLTINQSTTTTYPGAIAGGTALNLAKTGAGQFTLTGDLTGFGGLITVSNGTLLVNSSGGTAGGAVNVAGGTLGGNGYISGSVAVYPSGTLAPGSNSLETLTIGGDLTFSSSSTSTFQVNGDTSANSQVSVNGNVTYAGGLNLITNGTFTLGQTFTLFTGGNTASTPSNFSSVAGSPGTGLAWSFTNGVLSVVTGSSYANYPTNITATVADNQLTLTWPTTHLGWILQSQTNALSVGLMTPTNAWFDVIGSDSSNTNVITINPANPTVFYRLRMP